MLERAAQPAHVRQKQPKVQKPPSRKPPKAPYDPTEDPAGSIVAVNQELAVAEALHLRDGKRYYELLVDSRRLQLINPTSNIKVTSLKARTDVYRITGLMPDIPVDFQTLIARFPTLTKPI
ncbi:unnamed protein product, partial [Echinostoma caproni]|uniref:KTSC domain-containing protein n=1 Tax=Echinostoma caproni TaxID=27848 RepID=A0A183ADJ3_9TREM